MTWKEFRRATVQITARNSAQPGNICVDRRVTTPRCIVNEDSGMRNFVKTNKGTQNTLLHCQRIQRNCSFEVTGQMAAPRARAQAQARARRRPTVTLGVLNSYHLPGFIHGWLEGWPQHYIASLWTQYRYSCSHSQYTVYDMYIPLFDELSQCLKQLSTYA